MHLYINRKTPVVTYALAVINAVIFCADVVTEWIFGVPVLTLYGAKVNEYILLLGQWWRLFTPMFLHSGLTHLICNVAALVIWGRQCEQLLGPGRFLVIYLASGVLGCCASFAFSNAMSVGASGAIFGLFGALLVFREKYREIFNAVFGTSVLIIIAVNILNGFIVPNIDNFGHFGGLIGGFLACSAVGFYKQRGWTAKQTLFVFAYLVLAAALIGIAFLRFLAL